MPPFSSLRIDNFDVTSSLLFQNIIQCSENLSDQSEKMKDETNCDTIKLTGNDRPTYDQYLQLLDMEANDSQNDGYPDVEFVEGTFGDKLQRRETIHEVSGIMQPDQFS